MFPSVQVPSMDSNSNINVLMFSVKRCRSALCRLNIRVFWQASYSIMTRGLSLQRRLVLMQQDVITIDFCSLHKFFWS